ncbi:hypothetical protein ACFOVU_27605 [Nocardiopsis sediminis]|uniref:DUF4232 domain-containing protein n=1 Tax=Nocardiopsis sediminis TaxID=1778267 RepID=A0ABV8FU82_9ACTN
MRRVASILGSLLLTTAIVLAGPAAAQAATGTLLVNGHPVENPSGCHEARAWPMTVENRTDRTAVLYSGPGCQGVALGEVGPGAIVAEEFAVSVAIP